MDKKRIGQKWTFSGKYCFFILLVVFVLISPFQVWAQEGEEDATRGDWIISPVIDFYGLHMDLGYRGVSLLEGRDTIFWVGAGAFYKKRSFFRFPDGDLYIASDPSVDPAKDPYFYMFQADWTLGMTQGFLWNDRIDRNLLEAFLFYKGRYNKHFVDNSADQLLFRSIVAPDREGLFQNSLLLGLSFNDVSTSKATKVKKGIYSEASVEWGPSFLLNTLYGEANCIKLDVHMKGFLPLVEVDPAGDFNLFSMYAGANLAVDYTAGTYVPRNISQSFGGLAPKAGLGGAVRGVFTGSYDTPFKAVFNADLRFNLPSLVLPDILPVLRLTFDAGYYNELNAIHSGVLLTTGGEIGINFFNFVVPSVGFYYFINGENVDRSRFMIFDLAFGFHF